MTHTTFARLVLILIGSFLVAGCGGTGPPGRIGPSPTVVSGPKADLLRTPGSVGYSSFEVSVAFSPDGRSVAVGRMEAFAEEGKETTLGTVVTICDAATAAETRTIRGPMADSCAVAFSPDGRTLAVGLESDAVTLLDPDTGRERSVLGRGDVYGCVGLAFSGDGRRLAVAMELGQVVVWDLASGRILASVKAHTR